VEDIPGLEPWAELWYLYVSASFLNSYLKTTKDSLFIPKNPDELQILLRAYLLEKAIYELGYELNNRPDWIQIPMKGIESLLQF
jgi:maltose alpha-D-glucosyltransferase/alpha-amylase